MKKSTTSQRYSPRASPPLSPLHEPLYWRAKCDPKAYFFLCSPFYGRACRWAMLGESKPKGPKGPGTPVPVTHGYQGLHQALKVREY